MNAINKYLPFGLKAEKIMPFFIIFKLLTFSGFIAYMMNRWNDISSASSNCCLTNLSTTVVLIWDFKYNPFGVDKDGI